MVGNYMALLVIGQVFCAFDVYMSHKTAPMSTRYLRLIDWPVPMAYPVAIRTRNLRLLRLRARAHTGRTDAWKAYFYALISARERHS